mmetsp:Transcript_32153/g.68613  ORF Transcript_32153/g.68613 Transcript_32153/m.68613 type:complete len:95 (+) Transcript_32153:171-455(+)
MEDSRQAGRQGKEKGSADDVEEARGMSGSPRKTLPLSLSVCPSRHRIGRMEDNDERLSLPHVQIHLARSWKWEGEESLLRPLIHRQARPGQART